MKVLVCGGRDFQDEHFVFDWLDKLHKQYDFTQVIHGDARGADTLAKRWAKQEGIPQLACPADWEKHGKSAGFIRNKQMLVDGKPDMVVAFPGGRGTMSMTTLAKAAGVTVLLPEVQEEEEVSVAGPEDRKLLLKLLPIAAVEAASGVHPHPALSECLDLVGRNQNGTVSFSAEEWTAARDTVNHLTEVSSLIRQISRKKK
jgi:hypothetical protein